MAEEQLSEDRNEEPTARRLQKAREDGEVARSTEVPAAAVLIAGTGMLYYGAGDIGNRILRGFSDGFRFDHGSTQADWLLPAMFGNQLLDGLLAVAPVLLITIMAALIGSGLTGGYVFSTTLAAPKLDRINPLAGFQRIFGARTFVELLKSLLKCALVGTIVWLVIDKDLAEILHLGRMDAESAIAASGRLVLKASLTFALSLAVIALADAFYQRHAFLKRLRMSKQDIKDELKDTEGRPEVRAQIRRRQREMANSRMIERIRDADVVITNPEHFAVALTYDPGQEGAPVLLAKGVDSMAARIIAEAGRTGVHVLRAAPLARALYFTTRIGDPIPEALYHAVARIIAYVFSLNSFQPGMRAGAQPAVELPPEMRFDAQGHRESGPQEAQDPHHDR